MTSVANKIIELQDKIRETENYIARYEGQRDSLIEELKQKFNGLAIENAEEHLNKLDEQLKEKQEEEQGQRTTHRGGKAAARRTEEEA